MAAIAGKSAGESVSGGLLESISWRWFLRVLVAQSRLPTACQHNPWVIPLPASHGDVVLHYHPRKYFPKPTPRQRIKNHEQRSVDLSGSVRWQWSLHHFCFFWHFTRGGMQAAGLAVSTALCLVLVIIERVTGGSRNFLFHHTGSSIRDCIILSRFCLSQRAFVVGQTQSFLCPSSILKAMDHSL